MINENKIEVIKKLSYYCQSCHTSMSLFNDLVINRKLDVIDALLVKIIEDLSNLMKFYSALNLSASTINDMNGKLQLFMEAYENSDYYYIRDIFKYEMIPLVESIFVEVKNIVYNINSK